MTLSKQYFFGFLYISCILVSFFSNYELTFLIWLTTILVSIQQKYSVTIVKYILVFTTIFLIAAMSTMFYSNITFAIIKDTTYLLKPILGMLIGYQICKSLPKNHFMVFINAGLVLAFVHICLILIAFLNYRSVDMNLIRHAAGYFSDYEVYVLIVLIFHKNHGISIAKNKRIVFIILIAFSVFMYLARTNFLQFAILFLGMKGYFFLTKKSIIVIFFSITALLLAYSAIYYANPKRNGKGLEGLMYKIKISPQEAFKTKIDKDDWKDFNDNYRSFENIIAVKQVSHDGLRAVFFGKGLGSSLNLGQKIYTTDGSIIQFIAITHNGFMTVFLKSGLLGVMLLIVFLIFLYRQKKTDIILAQNINLLLIGTSVFLVLSTWIFMGLYFKLDNKSIVIGFLLGLREKLIYDQSKNETIKLP